jgi:hypothetical protein
VTQRNSLSQLVSRRLADLGLTGREAAARSGGLISHGHIYSIAKGGQPRRMREDTLRGLALALDLPLGEVQKAAGLPPEAKLKLPERAKYLSPKSQKVLADLASTLLAAEGLLDRKLPPSK